MLRRILYAAIVVGWHERNYFQVQAIIFKCSLIMIYIGYFRPFDKRLASILELVNEILILLCTYSLVMFTAFVPEASTRYLCGWYVIGLVFLLISINLVVIVI